MKHGWMVMLLASGCYGGVAYDWQARAVIAVEPQRVPLASLGPIGATAMWLSVRTDDVDVVYPIDVQGTEAVLDSAFDGAELPTNYDPYYADVAARPRPGSLALALRPPYPAPPANEEPGEVPFTARFELSILGDGEPIRVPVRLAPRFDPCAFLSAPATLIPATAIPQSATCLDGSACATPDTPFVQTPTAITVPPFVIRIFVQTSCGESIG
jgi:hypothetical protein